MRRYPGSEAQNGNRRKGSFMAEFRYTARNAAGKEVTGTLTVASRRDVPRALAEQDLYPIRIEEVVAKRAKRKKVAAAPVSAALSQMADLLTNGVPLLRTIDLIADQSVNPTLREVMREIHGQVAEGSGLDEAMARYPEVFSELTVSMVRAGTEGAFLEDALKRIAGFLDLQEELKGQVTGAMIYPSILAIAGTLVTTLMIAFFVPMFAPMFDQMIESGQGLPIFTEILLGLSEHIVVIGGGLVVAIVGGIMWLRRWVKTPTGRRKMDGFKLRLPLFGKLLLNSAVSRFCRVLGTLLHNGVPLLRALQISSDSVGNRMLSEAILSSAENISSGETLSRPLATCGLFPKTVMAMITIAEESNSLDSVLINIADSLDRQIARKVDVLVRLLEPLLLVIMGTMIMFIILALLLPMFNMSGAVG
ncbi:MAG: type II secretion system F family protein [Planctomycetia bacterium]|nr:type II secretion system F family protein [Planctomycetia bacterium]